MTTLQVKGLPLVQCATWCDERNGHSGASHIKDQACLSEERQVHLTREMLVVGADDAPDEHRTQEYVGAYLQKCPLEMDATINLSKGGSRGVTLTLDEARRLGEALIALAARGADLT